MFYGTLSISLQPLAATAAMAVACAVLSVVVVARRWAFIGEGISHSGFGGAGLAWMIMLAAPSLADHVWVLYAAVILFCLGTAVAIGYLSHGSRITGDAAIGIFLVATLAFGFLAQRIYMHARNGLSPTGFDQLLFGGDISTMTPQAALTAIMVSAAVVLVVLALAKEILAYCFDPQMAAASGVRAGFVHYLLMILIAVTIIVGLPMIGSVLVTALLVLPGVTANLVSRRLNVVVLISVGAALVSAVVGVWLNSVWSFVPTGPAIVLTLFLEFLGVYFFSRVRVRS